ncbi:MAG: cyclic nucleotide-binding domain-containing protein [Bdellovibrionales bacterium]|nr:cyclic nucleotide-binding domain-containing protein [Bdellovibrionales bacterium]NQZ18486.1 cyclic nucleotide-binding domain-containing protein [Bdellovibrionales bacterium]
MGRLENYIPALNKVRIEQINNKTVISFGANTPFPIEEELIPFVKQLNGHLSLREVFSFLNRKGLPIHIEKSLKLLELFAKRDYLINSADFLRAYDPKSKKAAPPAKRSPHLNNLSHSYFSKERLVGLIQKTTLFSQCERAVAENILTHSTLENVQEGIKILKEGTTSSDFYILLAGEVGIYKNRECLAYLTPLSVFGESAAVFEKVRNADVITTNTCWLLKINASKLVNTQSPETFEAYKGLKSKLILNQTLAANPLFQNVPSDVMQLFISQCRIEKYAKEQSIISQGETSGDFYFILQGSVSIIKDGIPVTSLSEGDHFGEVAAVFHQPRTASVLTESNSTFLVLSQKSLFDVLCSHFKLAIAVEQKASARMKSTSNVMSLFEEDFTASEPINDEVSSVFQIDEKFLETTDTHFELEVIDYTTSGKAS